MTSAALKASQVWAPPAPQAAQHLDIMAAGPSLPANYETTCSATRHTGTGVWQPGIAAKLVGLEGTQVVSAIADDAEELSMEQPAAYEHPAVCEYPTAADMRKAWRELEGLAPQKGEPLRTYLTKYADLFVVAYPWYAPITKNSVVPQAARGAFSHLMRWSLRNLYHILRLLRRPDAPVPPALATCTWGQFVRACEVEESVMQMIEDMGLSYAEPEDLTSGPEGDGPWDADLTEGPPPTGGAYGRAGAAAGLAPLPQQRCESHQRAPKRRQGRGRQAPPADQPPPCVRRPRPKARCFYCGQGGHLVAQCPYIPQT